MEYLFPPPPYPTAKILMPRLMERRKSCCCRRRNQGQFYFISRILFRIDRLRLFEFLIFKLENCVDNAFLLFFFLKRTFRNTVFSNIHVQFNSLVKHFSDDIF